MATQLSTTEQTRPELSLPQRGLVTPPEHMADIANLPGVYAMEVSGDCMAPEYCDGDLALVDPNTPPEPGDIVIIYRHHGKPLIKRLIERGSVYLRFGMDNPRAEMALIDALHGAVHRVAGCIRGEEAVRLGAPETIN